MFDIVTIGSATRDVFLSSSSFKIVEGKDFQTGKALAMGLGSKLEAEKIVVTSGGGGTNTAVTFAHQGLKTACIGVVGKDANGDSLLSELNAESVDTSHFQIHDDDLTAYSVILVHESGERSIISYKGEGQHFSKDKLRLEELETSWVFLDSLGGHYDVLEGAVNWAAQKGVKIATNPGGKELDHGLEKLKLLFSNASVVIMNQEEASQLLGIPYIEEKKIFQTMDELVKGIFVMTKGPQGVSASDGQEIYTAGVPDSPIVERTGAGDAFSSGFVSEYIRSGDISKAIQFGTANASSVVTQYGAKAGILKKDDWGPWPLVDVKRESLK